MDGKCFLVQVKRTNGTYEKGVVVKDSETVARQSYHAYLGAYGYDHDSTTDYVLVQIITETGAVIASCVDDRREDDNEE